MSKLLVHEFTDVDGALRLDGTLAGAAGDFSPDAHFTVNAIEITARTDASSVFLRAVLPVPVNLPAGLIDPNKPTLFKSPATLKTELTAELKARVEESFRRLQTIEVSWAAGSFLGPAGSITVAGEAKLALRVLLLEDETAAKATIVASFRATMEASIAGQLRTYGVVCRCRFKGTTATLSLDLDDLNIALPDLDLKKFDLTNSVSLDVNVASKLAGVFSTLDENFTLDAVWNPAAPILVVRPDNGRLLFAVFKVTGNDLSGAVAASELATLTATVKHPNGFEVEASNVTIAVFRTGVIATATVAVKKNNLVTLNGSRNFGPLKISWENLRVGVAATTAVPHELRVSVTFERLMIQPLDDPSAAIALRGELQLTPSGVAVVELALVEPYPFVLVARTAAVLLRGAQKIIDLLGRINPQSTADVDGLKKVLDVLGKIAAAVARAVVFVAREVGEELAAVAKLLAQGVIKVAELLLELLKKLAGLAEKATPASFPITVQVRIALDPLELRQVVLWLPAASGPSVVSALGFKLTLSDKWRPVILVDFATKPGVYLGALAADATAPAKLASLSTDLWLQRPDNVVTAVRDTSDNGVRPQAGDDPLLTITATARAVDKELLIVLAGLQGGTPIFFHKATNKVKRTVTIPGGGSVAVLEGVFETQAMTEADIDVTFDFQANRVLPFLGRGEPSQDASSDSFLDRLKKSLSQVVTVKETKKPVFKGRKATGGIVLEIQAAGVKTEATIDATLDVDKFEVAFNTSSVFQIQSRRIQERALGLTWVVEQVDADKRKQNAEADMFTLAFAGSESGFELNHKEARMEIRFDGLSSDGEGVTFEVDDFRIGRGGLDVTAHVLDHAVQLNGLNVPFRFQSGRIEIKGGKLIEAVVGARGQLPPALIGDANCSIVLAFEFVNGELALKNGTKVELEKMGEPIVCHGTRFTLTITHLDLAFARDGGYHFYFLVTGSIRFTPKPGELEDGLLQHFKDIEISLEQAPLTGDPRVLLKHVHFQKQLKPKKTFPLFNIFTFELRGFGFHPASPKFEGKPALNVSGQIRFADIGDVMQPKIDFHELWIAPPKDGESLPRIKAEGLGIELQLAGSVKIRGAVLAVDRDTKTVEGKEFAPEGYSASGFLGEGAVDIPGFCAIEASLGFLEVERDDQPGERKKAFFLFLQADKLAVEIPTPVWTFYLREAGFGFGYRYTLAGIKDAENAKSAGALVRILDDVSKRQGDLARFSSWKPDPEKDNFTLALRGAFQPYPAKKKFDEKAEKEAVSPFFFDIVAALRSDFTFLMSARGWLGVNYASFLENANNFRERPMFRGYLYISVPRSELLLRAIADSKGFIGDDWPEVKDGPLRDAVQSVDWTTTLYIRPGLFHYEMGWPDQLAVHLVDKPNMQVTVRGGMIFRAAEDGLLYGYNIGADAFMRFEGRVGGSIGVALVAELRAKFVARVLAFLAANFNDSLVYGLVSLDARLTFSVEAWMDVDLGFTSFTIRIGFSFSVQFTAAVELALAPKSVGGRVEARIGVQAFGCTLSVGIGFAFNEGRLDEARARVQRFLALSITSEEPDAPPVFGASQGEKAIDRSADAAAAVQRAPVKEDQTPKNGLKPDKNRAQFGRDLAPTDFWLVLRRASVAPGGTPLSGGDMAYALLVPKEAQDATHGGFYAAPSQYESDTALLRSDTLPVHQINFTATSDQVQIFIPGTGFKPFKPNTPIAARWSAPIQVAGGDETTFTLAFLFDECFLTDTTWIGKDATGTPLAKPIRRTKDWGEPKNLRIHKTHTALESTGEARKQDRELHQKARLADAIEFPHDERAFQARSTVMTMFTDQFVTLAATGDRTKAEVNGKAEAHVTDLGLVLYGPAAELEKLKDATVAKFEKKQTHDSAKIAILNPRAEWFDRLDPVLANATSAVEPDGIKLDWRFSVPGTTQNPEFLLHHYEVVRTIKGSDFAPYTMTVKAGATAGTRTKVLTEEEEKEGKKKVGEVEMCAPDAQLIDTLAEETGVSPTARRALLPAFGEGEGLEAAKAWIQVFSGDAVTVTYSVTPVDTAGVRGLPRSFLVNIQRPEVPIRPAIGELRFVQTIPELPTRGSLEVEVNAPRDLDVYLSLNDAAWDDKSNDTMTVGDVTYTVQRIYRIVVDPEDIEPAGHYGSNAITSRLRGPGTFAPSETADELAFDVARDATVRFDFNVATRAAIQEIEPDLDERKKLPRWARLSDTNLPGTKKKAFEGTAKTPADFLRALWVREAIDKPAQTRVATRFFLQTILQFTHPTDPEQSRTHKSKRVTLPIEHIIIAKERQIDGGGDGTTAGQGVATLRPDAFEWAVPLALPPLGDGQVDAESGFARFRIPGPAAHISDAQPDAQARDAFLLERDPDRRVLTTVRFAAVPDWVTQPGKKKPAPLHGRSIAGFELYELDIDELAPLDTTVKTPLALDDKAWKRATRVARIEQLSREDAMLVPEGNFDWQGWQAHYPSETERVQQARIDRGGDSRPIRAAWYSDRETTAHFPIRRPRLRLLPLVPESAIADLMKGGRPARIVASLSDARLPALTLHPTNIEGAQLDALFNPAKISPFTRAKGELFSAADLRNLLLCIGWKPFDEKDQRLLDWITDPAKLDGITLQLTGKVKPSKPADDKVPDPDTGTTTIPLDFRSQVHPILEELLAELALLNRGDAIAPKLYRAYTVMPQPVVNLKAKNVDGFMANTAPEADPYGWQVLQTLGLASTVRLYDLAAEAFVSPALLASRVDSALRCVLARWRAAFAPDKFEEMIGQPFAEVFLRPGADRLPGPFGAVIAGDVEVEKPPALALDDDGLAFVQVSLRPRPAAVWTYMRQQLGWDEKKNANLFQKDKRLAGLAIRVTRATDDVEVARARGGAIVELTALTAASRSATLPIPAAARKGSKDDPDLQLYFRIADPGKEVPPEARPKIELIAEYETVAVPAATTTDPATVTRVAVVVTDSPLLILDAWQPEREPAGKNHPDPFDRFDSIPVEKWRAAYRDKTPAKASLDAFRAITEPAGYGVTKVNDKVTAEALDNVVTAFIQWSDRFLKYGVSRGSRSKNPNEAFLALCAPVKATPWRLAADSEGYITLTFLHSDRWGHARAYAVKPVARYQELLSGIGVEAQLRSVALVPDEGLTTDVGLAIAVAPRTEKIEAPVILSSRLVPLEAVNPTFVEIIVARHGEESLANSNRPLLGHLGLPASLVAFSRAYRMPDWPERMKRFFEPQNELPVVDILPAAAAGAPVIPADGKQITGGDINGLANDFPSLWKGADVWRVPTIPPHYRLIAFASERAGIVVSDVTTVAQEEMPRKKLENRQDELLPEKQITLTIVREDKKRARLVLQHPLLSHAQLTPNGDKIFANAADKDVALWPDPDVAYRLVRRTLNGAAATIEKEDADIRLVAAGVIDATSAPVTVRALGTDYAADDHKPVITRETVAPKHFRLETSLHPVRTAAALPLSKKDFGTIDQITRFNGMATSFAAILTPHAMTIRIPPLSGEKPDKYLERIGKIVIALRAGVAVLATRTEPWNRHDLEPQALARIAALEAWRTSVTIGSQTADDLAKQAPLPIRLSAPWARLVDLGDLLATGAGLGAIVEPWTELDILTSDPGTWLVVFDLAADKEATGIANADVPPVAKKGGRLYGQLADLILGSSTAFWLEAVDTRSRLEITPAVIDPLSHAETTPATPHARGFVERRIAGLPACFGLRKEEQS